MTDPQDVVARDFESPPRVPTIVTTTHGDGNDPQTLRRESANDGSEAPKIERRDSAGSRLTTLSSGSGKGMRHRKRSRTVTTYHEPENPSGENFQPGAEPGFDTSLEDDKLPAHLTNLKAPCDINIIDFSEAAIQHTTADNQSLAQCLESPRPEALPCRWISVNGLSWDVIKVLGNKYRLHRLAIEDLVTPHTRTKVDWYADHACIILTLQKLVRLHQHKSKSDHCSCEDLSEVDSEEIDEKFREHGRENHKSWRNLWGGRRKRPDILPRYLDRNHDGKVDEFVSAHSGVSEDTPVKSIRTLHRYESAQIPEHTAWMEKHSALAKEELAVSVEQVSIFLLADNCVISFFEHSADDVEKPILERLHSPATMLRRSCDASLLTQAIIDAIVDLAVLVRNAYNKARKELQIEAMTSPNIRTSRALHIFGEEVDMLQNLFKPIVHLVNSLRDHHNETAMFSQPPTTSPSIENFQAQMSSPPAPKPGQVDRLKREGAPPMARQMSDLRRIALKRADAATSVTITPLAHTYFGDVLDHCITMIAALEQMDASANNISTLIFNTVGAKTNNFMMILAIVTVFFAPLTFISGYFGMNFAEGSGLKHPFGFFWVVAVPALVCFMLLVFATMLWDNIRDFLAKRGVKARWNSGRLMPIVGHRRRESTKRS